jgi:hypothetical protein
VNLHLIYPSSVLSNFLQLCKYRDQNLFIIPFAQCLSKRYINMQGFSVNVVLNSKRCHKELRKSNIKRVIMESEMSAELTTHNEQHI